MKAAAVRRRLTMLGFACALAVVYASPAWAAGGGGADMPWNAPLQNLLDNLSGPTAQTLGMLMFVVGALMWGIQPQRGAYSTVRWSRVRSGCRDRRRQPLQRAGVSGRRLLADRNAARTEVSRWNSRT